MDPSERLKEALEVIDNANLKNKLLELAEHYADAEKVHSQALAEVNRLSEELVSAQTRVKVFAEELRTRRRDLLYFSMNLAYPDEDTQSK